MAHKGRYTPPQRNKKKSRQPGLATQTVTAAATAQPLAQAGAQPRVSSGMAAVPASVKYADLTRELRWVGLFTAAVVVLLVTLSFILK